ncbi:metalloregulator ArsR/SmtB family transcription factor [Microbacterium sp. ARD32]|uniref:ArsR/SmtB family transcription factor n=1 Tax=Microbacterium sp. ARD32 TaxID=2962577 RepID=UPI0028816B05|nr:metalloregulator ArsR/SmtB family transcription factor [Microbacterium sp. ARD32]MDT0156001.1 metalloregulator ArsR/SmtB family transcription factor [Microbacterium sp. ARD32]
MVVQTELSEAEIDRVFHALATATRRDILRRTIEREQSVSDLARDYEMSFAAVQKHVAVLEEARLIVKRAEGRERLVRANPEMIARARALLARYEELWRARIARLDDLLASDAADASTGSASRAGSATQTGSASRAGSAAPETEPPRTTETTGE